MKPRLLLTLGASLLSLTTIAQQGSQAIIKQRAKAARGIDLETEVQIIGE